MEAGMVYAEKKDGTFQRGQDAVKRLHSRVELLEQQLNPVLSHHTEKMLDVPTPIAISELSGLIQQVERAADRLTSISDALDL